MAKALKTAALVVGAVALVATGIGAAAGVGIGLGLSVGTLGTIATVASIAKIAAVGLTIGASLTSKKPSNAATGSQTTFSADPDAGVPYVIGRTGSAGDIVARFGFDTRDAGDNDRQSFVVVHSVGPVKSVGSFTVDRSPVSFASGAAVGAFAAFMWSTVQLGAMAEPALGFGNGAGTPPGWTAQHKLSGLAASTWTLRFDTKSKLYQNGVPAPIWVVEGGFAYDPRKDSTYPGGSGPHRMADPANTAAYDAAVATWEYTENPYLHALKWVHGIWQRDTATSGSTWQRVMGMGAPGAGIDLAAFVDGANVADANGWKVGGVIYSGDGKWDSLKKILQAGMGEPLALGARIGCLVNAPKVSLATITIDDVVGDASVGATQPRRDRINTITPRYRLEANNWKMLPAAPISVPAYVMLDRGKRSKVQDYPFIQQTAQAATAARYDIENAREFGPIVLPLKLVWMGYKPGDCVTANLPELGLNAQPILLLNRDLDPAGGIVTMTARSETAAKHAFALGQTTTPPPSPGVTGPALIPVPADGAWAITGTSIESGGVRMPALVVTGAVDAGTAERIVFEYRPFVSGQAANVGWIGAGIEPPAVTTKTIAGVASATNYEVAVSYEVRGFVGARRIIGPVATAAYAGVKGDNGVAAITGLLTNESHTVPADATGAVVSYAGATGAFRVLSGSTDVSSSFALSTADNPQALTVTYANQIYAVTAGLDANEDSAALTIRATGAGTFAGVTIDKVFSVGKSKAGANGAPAKLLTAISTSQTLTVSPAGALDPAGTVQNITFTAARQNTAAAVTWTARDQAGTVTNNFTGASVTIAAADLLTIINNAGPNARSMTMTASLTDGTTLTDTISVAKVQAGAQGAQGNPGAAGAAAITALLTNENHTLPALTDGTVTSYAGATGAMRIYSGAADVTGAFTLSSQANPQALTVSYSEQSYTVSGGLDANEENATLTIRATGSGAFAGVTVDKVFTLAKSKTGTAGVNGAAGANAKLLYATSTSQTLTVSSAGVLDPSGTAQNITFTAVKQNTTAAVTWTARDQAGATTNTYTGDTVTIGASDMLTIIANAGANARSMTMTASLTDGTTLTDTISVAKVQAGAQGAQGNPGAAGAPAITALLTNESHTLPALTDGTVTGYAGATGAFRIFAGSTDVSSLFSLTTQTNPQALTVGYSGQTYTVTAGLDANEENATLVIRATGSGAYAGVTVDKVFSLSKSKTGTPGAQGANAKLIFAASTSQTLNLNAAGALDPGGTAQNITFTATKQNTTAAVTWAARNQAGTVTNNFNGDAVTIAAADLLTIVNSGGAGARSMTMTASLTDGTTLTDTISVAVVQAGAQGTPGNPGISAAGISLSASPTQVKYTSAGAIVATDVAFTATRQNTASPTIWTIRNLAGESLFEGVASDFVAADANAWSSANGDQLTRSAATLSGLMAVSPSGGFIMEARIGGGTIAQRATISKVQDGAAGASSDTLGLGLITSGSGTVNVASTGTTVVTLANSSISLQSGRKLRLTLGASNPSRSVGSATFGASITVSVGGTQIYQGVVTISPDNEINAAVIAGASANLINNPASGSTNLTITYQRSGASGNGGSFTLAYSLERL